MTDSTGRLPVCTVYQAEHGYSASRNEMWLPGVYDSEQAARSACTISGAVLQALSDRVCAVSGENRAITMDDLRELT